MPPGRRNTSFQTVLASLKKRGRVAEAKQLQQRVFNHFGEVLGEKEILQLTVEELTGILTVFNNIYPKQTTIAPKQPSNLNPLEQHINNLQEAGYTVVYGAAYRGKR